MKSSMAAYVFVLKGARSSCFQCYMFTVKFLAAMAVGGMLPEMQCNHDQRVCPLQNITCQCVVTETETSKQTLSWYLHSELVGHFTHLGNSLVSNTNYPATVEVLENGLSSNLSFPAEVKSGTLTVECVNVDFESSYLSYSIEGLFLGFLIFLINLHIT